jgi:RNA polymerase sigma factor (sigma-70 family)
MPLAAPAPLPPPMPPHELAGLVERAREGDVAAFERLIAAYQGKVYTFAFAFTGQPDLAQDLAQDALVKVYRSLGSFRFQSAFTTWLYSIVKNTYLDAEKDLADIKKDEGDVKKDATDSRARPARHPPGSPRHPPGPPRPAARPPREEIASPAPPPVGPEMSSGRGRRRLIIVSKMRRAVTIDVTSHRVTLDTGLLN